MSIQMQHLSPVWTHLTHIIVERAEGPYIYDTDGERWLDFTTGIGVTNTGHCHPAVVEAIREQAGKLLHGQANIVFHQPMLELAAELRQVLSPSLDTFFFSNSGAEAVEAAVKLARQATGRPNVIVFQGCPPGDPPVDGQTLKRSCTHVKERLNLRCSCDWRRNPIYSNNDARTQNLSRVKDQPRVAHHLWWVYSVQREAPTDR